jgi:type II secretory pathway component PulF
VSFCRMLTAVTTAVSRYIALVLVIVAVALITVLTDLRAALEDKINGIICEIRGVNP